MRKRKEVYSFGRATAKRSFLSATRKNAPSTKKKNTFDFPLGQSSSHSNRSLFTNVSHCEDYFREDIKNVAKNE
jgi:hypothetical protein